jgi:SAM-dependent methyltransferase
VTDLVYPGGELGLFARAARWKSYLAAEVSPFLGPRVLEVGAGLGATTRALASSPRRAWLCLEPDPSQAADLAARARGGELGQACSVQAGTVGDLDPGARFDAVLYVDVLEHVADDRAELRAVARHIAPGGHLIVLGPAHPWLYSPFDAAVGHYRRYVAATLSVAAPLDLRLVRLRYLDAVGLVASAANRALLRQSMPTLRQVLAWDRFMVPVSRVVDPWLGYSAGKSILAVWNRP